MSGLVYDVWPCSWCLALFMMPGLVYDIWLYIWRHRHWVPSTQEQLSWACPHVIQISAFNKQDRKSTETLLWFYFLFRFYQQHACYMLLRSGFPLNTIGWEQGLTCSLTVSVGPLAGGEDRVAEEADVGGGKLLRHVALAVYLTGVRHLVENNDTLHLERKQKQLSAFFSTAALSVLSVLALCVLVLSLC